MNITVLAGIEKTEKAAGKFKNGHSFGGVNLSVLIGFNQIEIAPKNKNGFSDFRMGNFGIEI